MATSLSGCSSPERRGGPAGGETVEQSRTDLQDAWQEAKAALGNLAKSLGAGAGDDSVQIAARLASIQDQLAAWGSAVGPEVSEGAREAWAKATQAGEEVGQWLEENGDSVSEDVRDAWEDVKARFEELKDRM